VAADIVGSYGIPLERVFTVGIGQNHELSPPASRDWSTPRYLFVGVNWERKNGDALLRAFAPVSELVPDARLDLVGRHPPIDQSGVAGHGPLSLAVPAERERLQSLFERATVFVMPSLHEPAGIVYAEAASTGLPSIGTSDGGAATIIGPGGLVVDPHDLDAIVNAMLRLADASTARSLGELAQQHSKQFTWRKVAERIVRALAPPHVDTSTLATFL
jgi:glycosyltransferase involved in cell wall biosynthesis